jgi:hypothetical protein
VADVDIMSGEDGDDAYTESVLALLGSNKTGSRSCSVVFVIGRVADDLHALIYYVHIREDIMNVGPSLLHCFLF